MIMNLASNAPTHPHTPDLHGCTTFTHAPRCACMHAPAVFLVERNHEYVIETGVQPCAVALGGEVEVGRYLAPTTEEYEDDFVTKGTSLHRLAREEGEEPVRGGQVSG